LAQYGEIDFIDLDELIEQQTGRTPRSLYTEAPERFKNAEAEALETLIRAPDPKGRLQVLAAGGGLIDNDAALALVKQADLFCIYLEVSAETAWKRILANGPLPPFLHTAHPQETHKTLHERRAAAYKRMAHRIIPGEDTLPEAMAQAIIAAVGRRIGETESETVGETIKPEVSDIH
jgi:shikimate kinase